MQTVEEIAARALELSTADRLYLADLLDVSLVDAGVSEAWAIELERRLSAYDRGETVSIDASDLVERVRRKLSVPRKP